MTGHELSELIFKVRSGCINRDEAIRESCNLSPVEFRALTLLSERENITASEFAERLELSPSRVSRVIDRMVQTDLIQVCGNATDRRTVSLSLSSNGIEQKQQIESGKEQCNQKLEQELSEQDRREIGEALQKLIALM